MEGERAPADRWREIKELEERLARAERGSSADDRFAAQIFRELIERRERGTTA